MTAEEPSMTAAPARDALRATAGVARRRPAVAKRSFILAQTFGLAGITAWLTLIAINNINDPGTNVALMEQMLTMRDIAADDVRGQGLLWRAWSDDLARPLLYGVIVVQVAIVALMWRSVASFTRALLAPTPARHATAVGQANVALVAFMGLFLLFLIGGLWFGYWMFMGPVQGVHFTLLGIAFLAMLLVNQPAFVREDAEEE
ncbi:DUF2165 family protein [Allostreptomyces psammosilenae]|nr:DUF2165 family protein [Allostreptomyces psammosilenae]